MNADYMFILYAGGKYGKFAKVIQAKNIMYFGVKSGKRGRNKFISDLQSYIGRSREVYIRYAK
jgi:hypothetical protein